MPIIDLNFGISSCKFHSQKSTALHGTTKLIHKNQQHCMVLQSSFTNAKVDFSIISGNVNTMKMEHPKMRKHGSPSILC